MAFRQAQLNCAPTGRDRRARDWELDLMKREQLSKGEPINCSGSRSRTTKRAAPPREGAPTRAKIVICKIPSFGEHRGDLRSISGSDSPDFSKLLIDQVAFVLGREADDFDEWGRQTEATLAAIVGIERRDEIEGMLVAQLGSISASRQTAILAWRRPR